MSNPPLPRILTGAEPYFYRGGPAACLGLHGFSASPAELRWLGEHLAGHGHTVYIPRLTAHGTDPLDMDRMRWRDWYLAALDAYTVLRQQCETLYVFGHSMGGLLTLLLASELPVDGLSVMATPLYTRSSLMPYARWLKYVMPRSDQPDRTTLPERLREEQSRRGEPVVGRVHYDRWSTRAVAELHLLMTEARARLADVTAPLLLIYSEGDQTVPLANQAQIAAGVSSRVVEQHTLRQSGHIIPQDMEREEAFARISDFFARLAQQ